MNEHPVGDPPTPAAARFHWQPIETAPKDVEILTFAPPDKIVASIWFFGSWATAEPVLGDPLNEAPTHWSPKLPSDDPVQSDPAAARLTVEQLAREAGGILCGPSDDSGSLSWQFDSDGVDLARFAALVRAQALEEAAAICERKLDAAFGYVLGPDCAFDIREAIARPAGEK